MDDPRIWIEPADAGPYGIESLDRGAPLVTDRLLARLVGAQVFQATGPEFFDALARFLNTAIDADLVFVGMVAPEDQNRIRTQVTFADGQRVSNFEYDLDGTPCSNVMGPRSICVYSRDVTELFPGDTELKELNACGYAGLPLFGRDGTLMGICVLVTLTPIEDPKALAQTLRLFGHRAELELERAIAGRAGDDVAELERLAAEEEQALWAALGATDAPEA